MGWSSFRCVSHSLDAIAGHAKMNEMLDWLRNAVVAVYFESDNSFHTGYVGCKNVLNTVGALEVLKQDYMRDNVEFDG